MRTIGELVGLSGRKALLTGGAGSIGRAIGEALVELGATVAVLDVDETACRKTASALSALKNGSAVALPCDLTDENATRDSVAGAVEQFGGLDILIHCAAHGGTTANPGWAVPFKEQTVEAWDRA